jgi:spermidine synthase
VAVVGLGSGDTAWAVGCRPEVRHIRLFEIALAQPEVLRQLARTANPPYLSALFTDPRIDWVFADGRNRLSHDGKLYDVIEADALYPDAAYSGNLYSVEFFQLAADRLKPGGLVVTWAPTSRIGATFASVFPSVLAFANGKILVGRREPLPVELDVWTQRVQAAPVQAYLGDQLAKEVEDALRGVHASWKPAVLAPNYDLRPRDEFMVSR